MYTCDDTESTTETRRFQCCHIFPDGHRCGSPALRQEEFCYYHHTSRGAARQRLSNSLPRLPEPHDLTTRPGIQLAIAEILQRIAAGDLDQRHAGLLLYGLQVASTNLPRDARDPSPQPTIEELVEHPTHGLIAPPTEYTVAEEYYETKKTGRGCSPETMERLRKLDEELAAVAAQSAYDRLRREMEEAAKTGSPLPEYTAPGPSRPAAFGPTALNPDPLDPFPLDPSPLDPFPLDPFPLPQDDPFPSF